VATIRLFAGAREAAGTGRDVLPGATVAEVLDAACRRYGSDFTAVLGTSQVWRNGQPAAPDEAVGDGDEVAVLPPVSGGADAVAARSRPSGWGRSLADGLVGDYDVAGPRVRLGVLWAAGLVAGIFVGPWPMAVLLALVAGTAGLQTAAAWRRVGARPNRVVAGGGALAMPLAAAIGTGALGLVGLVVVGGAVLAASVRRTRSGVWANAGLTLRCGYVVGLAAGSFVVIRHLEIGAAVSLALLVCAYDLGDFLVGTDAGSPVEGPIAGIVAAVVVAFALGVFTVPPFGLTSALVFGALAAALFPLGQLAATELLPRATARAPGLRRLDSLLVVAPVWMSLLWRYLG
jgi:molybdopterin converting factor small subunit